LNVIYSKREEKVDYSVSWVQLLSSKFKYALNYKTCIAENTCDSEAGIVGEYKVSDDTLFRAKWVTTTKKKTDQLRVGLGFTQKLTPSITGTIGADINARQFFGDQNPTGSPHSVGFEVKLAQ